MNRWLRVVAMSGFGMIATATACSGTGDGDGEKKKDKDVDQETAGICADTCPKSCDEDADCDTPNGELCCDFGEAGSACTAAAACPRFCSDDSTCDTAQGLACLRVHPQIDASVCIAPEAAVRTCQGNESCGVGEVCCGIYGEPICLPADRCPVACSVSEECNTTAGQVCCTTLSLTDESLGVPGLCVDPNVVPCPKACAASNECNTAAGELCCDGVCDTSCAKSCEVSDDCTGQICCKSPVVQSAWAKATPVLGYPTGAGPSGFCPTANNGICDEPTLCAVGTDVLDCGGGQMCEYANDGYCDEPDLCPPGTDAADCGGCVGCGDWLQSFTQGYAPTVCASSQSHVEAVYACVCGGCGGACTGACTGAGISEECSSCATSLCPNELSACLSF